jgi:hypothetical protein
VAIGLDYGEELRGEEESDAADDKVELNSGGH